MNQVAKFFGISLVAIGAGFVGALLTATVFSVLGLEAGFWPFLVGGIWSGEFINSVIYSKD